MTSCAAEAIAWAPEPHTRLTVMAGTSTGKPAIDGRLSGRVHLVARLDDVAHDHRLDLSVIEPGPLRERRVWP